jgi:hypothetical protein
MAVWRKVIVSGSNAQLASLQVSDLLNGVVTGSANGTLGIQAINGTGNIVATTNATNLVHSGSFSGSFAGPLTGTASFATSASFAETSSLPLRGLITASINSSTITFTKGDNTTFDITVAQGVASSTSTITMNNTGIGTWYPTFVVSGSGSQSLYVNSASFSYNAATNTLNVTSSFITASNVFGPFGANSVLTASYALNAPVTTGSNTFVGNQIISGTFTVVTGSGTELSVLGTGVKIGNAITDVHTVTGSLNISGSVTATNFTGSLFGTASWAVSASQAITAAFASTAASANSLANALTFGVGISGSAATYNGSTAVTVHVSGAANLTTGNHPKWSGTGFVNSLISDNGTTVTIASGSTISAGGLTVTGNSTFNNNLTVTGDLSVAGTASFTNTDNLNVRDKFILVNSGSSTLADSGWITQYNTAGSGSAFYLEAGATNDHGPYGRFAVAFDAVGTANSLTPNEYVVTAKINQGSAPTNTVPPTWGTGSNGSGNMWVTNTGDIYIWA